MSVIARSVVIDMLCAAQGEHYRAWYEGAHPYGPQAVDRAMAVLEAQQPRGAVALDDLREIAAKMYEGMEVGSPEQLAVSEFLGRAEGETDDHGDSFANLSQPTL